MYHKCLSGHSNFKRRVKEDNFYSAWYALRNTLEGTFYNPDTGSWEWGYNADENIIREALEDFNDIVTQILTSDMSVVKSLEKAPQLRFLLPPLLPGLLPVAASLQVPWLSEPPRKLSC